MSENQHQAVGPNGHHKNGSAKQRPRGDARINAVGELLDHRLPSDPLAEKNVLGGILLNPGLLDEFDVRADHFSEERHRTILGHLATLRENNQPIDVAHLVASLEETGQFDEIGRGAAISECMEAAVSPSRFAEYLGSLHDKAARRALFFVATRMIQGVHSPDDTGSLIADFQRRIASATNEAGDIRLAGNKAILLPLPSVQRTKLEWLWPARFPLGKFCLLIGDPGDGKSLLTADMAARVSVGAAWPASVDHAPQGRVLLICCEDDAGDTIRPRLEAAGADLSMVDLLQGVSHVDPETGEARERMPNLQTDVPLIEGILARGGYKLVVFDTITGFLGKCDNNSSTDVRNLLTPLSVLAAKHGVSIVGVQHLTKNAATAARYRTNGSVAYNGLARSVMAVARDHREKNLRLLVGIKANLGPKPATLGYVIDAPGGVPRLEWLPVPVEVDADEALGPAPPPAPKRDEATEWLEQFLAAGPQLAKEIYEAGEVAGHSKKTLQRAKKELGAQANKVGLRGAWQWELTKTPTPSDRGYLCENTGETVAPFEDDQVGSLWDVATFEDGQPNAKGGQAEEQR